MLISFELQMFNYLQGIVRREELAQGLFPPGSHDDLSGDRKLAFRGLRRVYSARMGIALAEMQRQGKLSAMEFEDIFERVMELIKLKFPKLVDATVIDAC